MFNLRYVMLLLTMAGLPHVLCAQSPAFTRSPTALATAHSTTFTGTDALMANPAGLYQAEASMLRFGATTRFGEMAFTTMEAVAIVNLKPTSLEISASHFGDEALGIDRLSIGGGHRLGIASLGIRLHTFSYRTEVSGTRVVTVTEAGGIAELTPTLKIGAWILNPAQSQVSETEYFPTLMSLGMAYQVSDNLDLLVETEKDISLPAVWKAGLRYRLNDYLDTMLGLRSEGYKLSAGMAFRKGALAFHYTSAWAGRPGFKHQLAIDYQLARK